MFLAGAHALLPYCRADPHVCCSDATTVWSRHVVLVGQQVKLPSGKPLRFGFMPTQLVADVFTAVRGASGIGKEFTLCSTFPVREFNEDSDGSSTLSDAGPCLAGRVLCRHVPLLS